MKKIITFIWITFFLSLFINAQNLQLSASGNILTNGDTVTVTGGLLSTLSAHVDVKNNAADTLSVKCKRFHVNVVMGSENSICWGGGCWPINVSQTPNPTDIGAGATATEFTGDYKANGNEGISIIRYTFFDMNNVIDSVCFIAKFDGQANFGFSETLKSTFISDIYPNPADKSGVINYALTEADKSAKVVVHDMIGNEVRVIPVTEKEGTIRVDTYNLTEGIYFYSFIFNNKIYYSKKLIIDHR